MELNEIGGSLHRAPGLLQVDGRQLSPLHGSRWRSQFLPPFPKLLPDLAAPSRESSAQKTPLCCLQNRTASPLPSEEGGSDLREILSRGVSEGEILAAEPQDEELPGTSVLAERAFVRCALVFWHLAQLAHQQAG